MKFSALLSVVVLAGCTTMAHADNFTASYLDAGVQSSSTSTYVENFTNATVQNGTLTTTFNGSGITGTYSGDFTLYSAGAYGGAGGSGQYISTSLPTPSQYTLSLSGNVNYFGLWFSALDANNTLSFYNGSNLLYSFTAADFLKAVGSCPCSAYCGNPNNGQDSSEQFSFINFYDTNGTFNKIVFSEAYSSGTASFESDNHTLGDISTAPGGTAVTPEPSSLALLGTGALGVIGAARRRFLNA